MLRGNVRQYGMIIALAATIWLTLQDAWGTGHALAGLGLLVWGMRLRREGRPNAYKRLRDRLAARYPPLSFENRGTPLRQM